MLTRRLTMAAFAALFAASSSLAMLQQGARPASAHHDEHWRRHAQHERHDRDDRRFRHANYAAPAYYTTAYANNTGTWVRRNDHDRDDRRRHKRHADNGNHNGWYKTANPGRRHLEHNGRKPHVDPWRDHR